MLLVLGLVAILAAICVPSFRKARANSYRARCDVKLKAIGLALDAFKQENRTMPTSLDELVQRGYLPNAEALHCPSDPDPNGTYDKFYVIRSKDDYGDLPVVVCPYHEQETGHGAQMRLSRFTTQFGIRPAVLSSGNNVSVVHPGAGNAEVGYPGMELHGGDRIVTNSGTALITFADSSTARLESGADVTVLESFLDEQTNPRLYTILKQVAGVATYTVNHGSRFDVTTPSATAGARGTQFQVVVNGTGPQNTQLKVLEGQVVFTTPLSSGLAPLGQLLSGLDVGGLLKGLFP